MRHLPLVCLVMFAGCTIDEPVLETAPVDQALTKNCPDWMCGSNSPEIEHRGLADLNILGLPNSNGFRLASTTLGGLTWQLAVVDGEIHLKRSGQELSSYDVTGAVLRVTNDNDPTLVYNIRISQVSKSARFWAEINGYHPLMLSYLIEWSYPPSSPTAGPIWKNICVKPDNGESTLGLDKFLAVVFEGDRIDAARKRVTSVDTNWFNIGCAGHALAKLHLTGHTHAARAAGFSTTLDQRTTMLKMFSADYCGTGTPFTVAGVELNWKDDNGWMTYPAFSHPALEARWTPNGAACLNKPRVVANPTVASDAQFADVEADIARICTRPPPCTATSTTYHLLSANPTGF